MQVIAIKRVFLDKPFCSRHRLLMLFKNNPQQDGGLRDDNLRLIFSEAELKFLKTKRQDVIAGLYAVTGVICATFLIGVYFFATPFPALLRDTRFELITVTMGLMGYLGVLITIASPIIIIGLLIELRTAARAKASLVDLLIRYNRPVPGED